MLMSQCIKLKAQSAPQTENLFCYQRGGGEGGIKEVRVVFERFGT